MSCEHEFDKYGRFLDRFPVALRYQRRSRVLRSSSIGQTVAFDGIKHTTRLFLLQRSSLALVSTSLIGTVDVGVDFLLLSVLRDVRGFFVLQALAKQ